MKKIYDLSKLDWKLSGYTPYVWWLTKSMEVGATPEADVCPISAKVPGSVQGALRDAGIIPDWNEGLNARACEWVENRHWVYKAILPDEMIESGKTYRLRCNGLDYSGWVYLNGQEIDRFEGTYVPHTFDITPAVKESGNILQIVFDMPPRWLGQIGFTSEMTEWKARFNYTWDWVVRLVQIGIWDRICLESVDGAEISELRCYAQADSAKSLGSIKIKGGATGSGGSVQVTLSYNGNELCERSLPAAEFNKNGIDLNDIPVELWWPNGHGSQPLYDLTTKLLDSSGSEQDAITRRVGFKEVTWQPCEGAPAEADPWICVVNGKPIFLQGANWTPIHPNFADTTYEDYRKRLAVYKNLGFNIMRVWGGAILERKWFYDLCDELGIFVWQEFPLSSSGCDNYPPEDEKSIADHEIIARSYIARRQHHVSLLLWCGGNELMYKGTAKPVEFTHPLIKRYKEVVEAQDPTRRMLPTSASGPVEWADPAKFGVGQHWDVHGPWKCEGNLSESWDPMWKNDDAFFRSETGSPSASPVEIIRRSQGNLDAWPVSIDNPLWRRTSLWWIEADQFKAEHNREPNDLEEYVAWSQERQKQALMTVAKACKDRFPRCGGIIIWMGHDCYPCNANTSIIDVDGNPKPAALGLGEIFRAD
ncbi:MAG: glycoside hydrolase family 2 TIM barrel-domain containing protein [Armatimonadota bacterium]